MGGTQRGSAPVATGRSGSSDQADQEPGYSAASKPAIRSAATACAAVTPEPQYTPTSVPYDAERGEPGPQRSAAANRPSGPRLSAVGVLSAPGIWPARGSTGSVSPR